MSSRIPVGEEVGGVGGGFRFLLGELDCVVSLLGAAIAGRGLVGAMVRSGSVGY